MNTTRQQQDAAARAELRALGYSEIEVAVYDADAQRHVEKQAAIAARRQDKTDQRED